MMKMARLVTINLRNKLYPAHLGLRTETKKERLQYTLQCGRAGYTLVFSMVKGCFVAEIQHGC